MAAHVRLWPHTSGEPLAAGRYARQMPDATRLLSPAAPIARSRAARFLPASFDEADHSIEVVWTTGAAVLRFDWLDGGYYSEELSTDAAAVRLDRLNAGAALLDSHKDGSLASIVGSVVPGSARMEAGKGIARVRLAETPDVTDIVAKVKAGHARSISVGYRVYTFQRTETAGEHPTMLATDWEPTEISLVAVPADPGAQIRSEPRMPDAPTAEAESTVSAKFVREKCRNLGFNDADTLSMIELYTDPDEPHTRSEFLDAIVSRVGEMRTAGTFMPGDQRSLQERFAASRALPIIDPSQRNNLQQGSPEWLRQQMAGAIYARIAGKEPTPESRPYMGATLIDMARGLLVARGESAQFMSPAAVWQRHGAMTTSDFPLLLGAPVGAFLNETLAASPPALQIVAKKRTTRDFKPITGLTLDGAASLDFLAENAEYTYAAFSESGTQYTVKTFGKMFSLSRQAIINDNLEAFTQASARFVRAAASKRADFLAAVLTSNNPIPSIGGSSTPLFHASHGNLAGSGSALSTTSLGAARLAMRTQKDTDNATYLDVQPKYLVVGPALETQAEAVLTAISSTTVADVNVFSGKLVLVVEPRIVDNSWYLFADPSQYPVLEYATLEGQPDVFTDTRATWETDGVESKVRIDFGAAATDYRGGYKNPGV